MSEEGGALTVLLNALSPGSTVKLPVGKVVKWIVLTET
jgi:hypothetical protein